MSERISQETPKRIPERFWEDLSQRNQKMSQHRDVTRFCGSQAQCKKMIQKNTAKYIRKKMLSEVLKICQKIVRKYSERMWNKMSGDIPERISERVPEETSNRMSGTMPKRKPEGISKRNQKNGQKEK